MPTLWVDTSNYQGYPNWAQVKADGVEGAIAKVNEGSSMDPAFAPNWRAIQAAGLRRGAYDFGWTANDPVTEANIFLNAINAAGGLTPSDILVMDIEEVHGPVATGSVAQWTYSWCSAVKSATGITPWVYSYWSYITNNLQDARLTQFPLWFAYPSASPPRAPAPWSEYVAWQYGQGAIPGIGGLVDEDNVYLNPVPVVTWVDNGYEDDMGFTAYFHDWPTKQQTDVFQTSGDGRVVHSFYAVGLNQRGFENLPAYTDIVPGTLSVGFNKPQAQLEVWATRANGQLAHWWQADSGGSWGSESIGTGTPLPSPGSGGLTAAQAQQLADVQTRIQTVETALHGA